jgi:protein TonB
MYLSQKHFNNALIAAFTLHILLLLVYAVNVQLNHTKVLDKPVYVKLGERPKASRGRSDVNRKTEQVSPRPVIKAPIIQPREVIPVPKSMQPAPVKSQPSPITQIIEKIKTVIPTPAKIEQKKELPKKKIAAPKPQAKPKALPPLVQHFRKKEVTSNPAPAQVTTQEIPFVQNLKSKKYEVEGVSGHKLGNRTKAEQETITSYEKKLALWLQKHHYYPPAARHRNLEGEAVVRLQIDRLGNIRFFELAEPTEHLMLDDAVIQMIERSDPVPPVPDSYPGDFVIEFLIPVTFKLH